MPYRSDENGTPVHYDNEPEKTPVLRSRDHIQYQDPMVKGYPGYGDAYQQSQRSPHLRTVASIAVRLFREWSEADCHPDPTPEEIVAAYDLREKLAEAMLDLEDALVRR